MGRRTTTPVLKSPRKDSIFMFGKAISIQAISRQQKIDPSHLSKVLSGERTATITCYLKICGAIGVGLEELLEGIRERREAILKYKQDVVRQYGTRHEVNQRNAKIQKKRGKPVVPQMPTTVVDDETYEEGKKILA